MTNEQLQADLDFLLHWHYAGNGHSAQSMVGIVYGFYKMEHQSLPSDYGDLGRVEAAWNMLPEHRKTPEMIEMMKKTREAVVQKDEMYKSQRILAMKAKAEKWDKLDKEISAYYFDDNDDELEDEEGGDLLDIGEAAARAFGYM